MQPKRLLGYAALALLAANAAVCMTQAVIRAREPLWSQDLLGVYRASRLWLEGVNPYQAYSTAEWQRITHEPPLPKLPVTLGPSTLYPPVAMVVLAPISWLSWQGAVSAWLYLKLILAVVCPLLIWKLVGRNGEPWLFAVFLLLWFGSQGLRIGLAIGQHTLVVLTLVAGAFVCLQAGKERTAGLLLAVGLYKYPLVIFFLLLLTFKRRFRVLAWTGAGSALLLAIFFLHIDATVVEVYRGIQSELAFWSAQKGTKLRTLWATDVYSLLRLIGERWFARITTLLFTAGGAAVAGAIWWKHRQISGTDFALAALFTLWGFYNGIYNTMLLIIVLPHVFFEWRESGERRWKWALTAVGVVFLGGLIGFANHIEQVFGAQFARTFDDAFRVTLRLAVFGYFWAVLWRRRGAVSLAKHIDSKPATAVLS